MKAKAEFKSYRELGKEELEKKLGEVEHELMSLRFRHSSGQLGQTHKLQSLRKDIARLKTASRLVA